MVDVTVFQSAAVVKDGNSLTVAYGGIVGGNDTVAKGAVLTKINRTAFSNAVCRPPSDGEAVYHGGGGFREVHVLVQHTTHIVAVKCGNVVGITVIQIKISGFRAVESTIHPHIGFDFVAVDRCCVARVGAFLHINEGSCIGIGRCCIHGLLQLHGVLPCGTTVGACTCGCHVEDFTHGQIQRNHTVALLVSVHAVRVSTLFADTSAIEIIAVALIYDDLYSTMQYTVGFLITHLYGNSRPRPICTIATVRLEIEVPYTATELRNGQLRCSVNGH